MNVVNNTRKQRHLGSVYSRHSVYRHSYHTAEGEPKKRTSLGQRSFYVQSGNFVQTAPDPRQKQEPVTSPITASEHRLCFP